MAVQENEYASMEKNKLNKKFDWEEEIRLLHVKHCCSWECSCSFVESTNGFGLSSHCHRKLIPNLSFQFSFACGIQFSLFWTIIILIRMLHIRSALFGRTSLITFKEYAFARAHRHNLFNIIFRSSNHTARRYDRIFVSSTSRWSVHSTKTWLQSNGVVAWIVDSR